MKRHLLFSMMCFVLSLFLALGGALAEENAYETYLVDGLSVYAQVNPFFIATGEMTPSGPRLTQEDIDDVLSVTWTGMPEGAETTDAFVLNEDGTVSAPMVYFVASAEMSDQVITCTIDRNTHDDVVISYRLANSDMAYNGQLDGLSNLTYEKGAYYLTVHEGDTIALASFIEPAEKAAFKDDFSYAWTIYGQGPEDMIEFDNEALSYTVQAEDDGKILQYFATIRMDGQDAFANYNVMFVLRIDSEQ